MSSQAHIGSTGLLKRLFTVQEYNRMIEVGIFTAQDRLELLRGEIIQMSPIGIRHAAQVNRLNLLFFEKLGRRVIVSVQNPIELDDRSEPQPDLVLLRPRMDFYASGHPQTEDIFLIVEVADTTIDSDRNVKIPLYAEDGVLEVWLISVNELYLEVYRQPSIQGYEQVQRCDRGQTVSILAFPAIEITVDEILGL